MTTETDRVVLIAEARQWPRDGINEGALINALADELEREPVVVDDAMVLRFLNARNPRAATSDITDWGAETVEATRAALVAALTPDGQEGGR